MSGQNLRLMNSAYRPYFPELDGVRAIAALMVMAFHFSQRWAPRGFLVLGQTGVDLFFVLSGFLITTILLDARQGDWGEVRTFYTRRTLRIFPLYFGFLILVCVFSGAVSPWFWVYLQNWPMALGLSVSGPNHLWSLAVEEQFYLVWPFLILFWPRRWITHAMWGVIATALLVRIFVVPFHFSSFYSTVTRMDGLAAGGLVALYYRRGVLMRRSGWLGLGASVFASVLLLQWKVNHGGGAAWVQVTKYMLAAGFYGMAVGWVVSARNSLIHGFLRMKWMREIGKVSYGLYVFHPAIFGFLPPRLGHMPIFAKAAVSFAAVFLASLISWYGFERYFVLLKDKVAPEVRLPGVPVLVESHGRLDAA